MKLKNRIFDIMLVLCAAVVMFILFTGKSNSKREAHVEVGPVEILK